MPKKVPKGKYPLLDVIKDYPELISDPKKVLKLSAKDRVHQFFAWARERHSIYLLKSFYREPPSWSDIPRMSSTRWCNTYRELDAVTKEIMREVYKYHVDDPNMWFTAMICRYINHPDTLLDLRNADLLGRNDKWSWEKAAAVIDARKQAKLKFVTGAYLVNSVSSEGFPKEIIGSKPHVISYRLNYAWERRYQLQGEFKDTMERAFNAVSSVPGFGPFLTYQTIVDLSYFPKWLKKSPDINTFNSAGPGTRRGMQRVKYARRRDDFELVSQEETTEFLARLLECSRDPEYWPQTKEKNPGNGWAPLSMSNLSNCSCEYDKWTRIVLEEGETRSRYSPNASIQLF